MGDRSENQGDWRKQTVDYWKRSNAKFGITDSAKNTGGKGDVISGRTTGGRNNKRGGFIRPWQTYFSKQLNNLFHRVGKIKNYKVLAEFFETLTPIQQKGRRVPITLQEKVDKEISKLLQQGHIEKLEECSDKYFVSSIVITVKKDGSVKLALGSRELNKQVHKNKNIKCPIVKSSWIP